MMNSERASEIKCTKWCYMRVIFTVHALFRTHLCSRSMLFSGASPMHALNMFSSIARCLLSAFTTGVPAGTSGALVRYDRSEETGCNARSCVSLGPLILMRVESSAIRHMSSINGAASRESSHVLCMTIVFVPPMKNFGCIFVHCTFAVPNIRHVLDHYHMIWMLTLSEK